MWGMPAGFAELLRRKYAIMQQEADAGTLRAGADVTTANSGANLNNIRAGLLPAQARAENLKTEAETGNILETTKYLGPRVKAEIGLMGTQGTNNLAQARLYGKQADGQEVETEGNRILNRGLGLGLMSPFERTRSSIMNNWRIGF